MMDDKTKLLEAVLFIENERVSLRRLMKMLSADEMTVFAAINELKRKYSAESESGILLEEDSEGYAFVPSPLLSDELKDCYGRKADHRLSKATIETLSVVAYSQPISKREIEDIRGVSSDAVLRLLTDRGYIKVVGHGEGTGRPCLYGTTAKFLEQFNLESIAQLPKLKETDVLRFRNDDIQGELFDET